MKKLKTTRYDIGAEVLSILTRGMYPDPKDAIREYIQNGVDANAKQIHVIIRKNTIVVQDDGFGMDIKTLRRAARIGVSDKNPGKDVGFMGIGIYSAFHLCDELTIYSHREGNEVCYIVMDFKGMRALLEEQKEKRLTQIIESDELIDLQSLLEDFVVIDTTGEDEFPLIGTSIELAGISEEFLDEFSQFDIIADYLKEVVPLEFDKLKFKWAETIETKITKICQENNAKFELVKVLLQVNNRREWLFRAYSDEEFSDKKSFEPYFKEIIVGGEFYGVIWGCLNVARKKIANSSLRGFLIKKQGFAIGDRRKLSPYFRQVYYDRYIGEVVIVNPKILPNAARNDIAYSNYRTLLFDEISKIAESYNLKAHEIQEYSLGDEQLDKSIQELKQINTDFTLYEKDPSRLIDTTIKIRSIRKLISDRLSRGSIRIERKHDANNFIKAADEIENAVQCTLNKLTNRQTSISKTTTQKKAKITESLNSIKVEDNKITSFDNILELFEALDIVLPDDIKEIMKIIDERIVQALADNKKHYHELMNELKEEFEKLD